MVSLNYAGDYEEQGVILIQAEKGSSAIVKGDVCSLSSNKWVTATTSAVAPFAVCTKSAAAADTTVQILIYGIVAVKADSAINPNNVFTRGTGTAGSIMANSTPAVGVGIYLAHENEGDGSTVATAAANTDVVRVFFRGGY